jgi:hypothetical protein
MVLPDPLHLVGRLALDFPSRERTGAMRPFIDPKTINSLVPMESPEVVEAKMRQLEEKRARDFDTFLRSLERK